MLGGRPVDMEQIDKARPVAVGHSPSVDYAADRGPGGAVEDMASAPGGGTVEGQAAHMGLVVRMVAHSKDRLQAAHCHNLDLAGVLAHSLDRMAQVVDGQIGCMLEA